MGRRSAQSRSLASCVELYLVVCSSLAKKHNARIARGRGERRPAAESLEAMQGVEAGGLRGWTVSLVLGMDDILSSLIVYMFVL